jgi:hypothetical protein
LKNMARIVRLWILAAAVVVGQDKPADPLAALEQTAEEKTKEWETLAAGLEARLSRFLPCDPRVQSAIEEVSRASDARVTAVGQYFEGAIAKAKNQAEGAKGMLAVQGAFEKEWDAERAEAEQRAAAIEKQTSELGQSAKRLASLGDAQKALDGIAETTRQRLAQAGRRLDQAAALGGILRDLVAAYQARQNGLESEASALAAEGERWGAYYSARLARAQTECAITKPQEKKQP